MLGDALQGAAVDCNSAEVTHAWFDSRVAHHILSKAASKMACSLGETLVRARLQRQSFPGTALRLRLAPLHR
jgi:hypothetical protein